MTMIPINVPRPETREYAAFYAGYIEEVAGRDLGAILHEQLSTFGSVLGGLSESEAMARYAPGKWRVFAYRALRISRGDATPLPGFDENDYVAAAGFDRRSVGDLVEEWSGVRASTLTLLRSVDPDAWERRVVANGTEVSLRALAHIIAGHVHHHQQVLRERYGLDFPEP
jgi:hypothetical protein